MGDIGFDGGGGFENIIWGAKVQFLEKKVGLKYFTTSYSMPFPSILHQNKALHTSQKGTVSDCQTHKKSRVGLGY